MYFSHLGTTLNLFAKSHRDSKVKKRFSTMVTGGSGIGKTDIIKQVGTDLDMAVVISHVSQLEPGELIGIPKPYEVRPGLFVMRYILPGYLPHYKYNDEGEPISKVFDDGVERKVIDVDLLGSKVKNKKLLQTKHGDTWKEKVKGVIIFLDEINRAVGDDTKQAIFELPGDYAIHEYEVPEHCVVFAAANPSTNDYQVNEMDQEKAWMDRFVHLKAEGRVEDSLLYFEKNKYDSSIISFINADTEALMEKEENFQLNVKRTPRSYEVLNNILKHVNLPDEDTIRREVFIGILGDEYGNNFTNHLKENLELVPSGEQIVIAYETIRERVIQAVEQNEMHFINQVTRYLYTFLAQDENVQRYLWREATSEDVALMLEDEIEISIGEPVVNEENCNNIVLFLEDLHSETRMSLVKQIIEFDEVNNVIGNSQIIFDTLENDSNEANETL